MWLNFSPQNVCGRDVTASRPTSSKPSKVILPAQGSLKACGWRWGDLWQSKSLTCYLDQTLAHLSPLELSSTFLWATSKLLPLSHYSFLDLFVIVVTHSKWFRKGLEKWQRRWLGISRPSHVLIAHSLRCGARPALFQPYSISWGKVVAFLVFYVHQMWTTNSPALQTTCIGCLLEKN